MLTTAGMTKRLFMKKPINIENVNRLESMRAGLNLQDAIKESGRCLLCEDAPCSKACPAGTDPAKFIRQIRFANYKGAARTIRNNNILGGVCAFTCPVEKLCEKDCTSKKLGDPIDINGLQRFACEYGKNAGLEPMDDAAKNKYKVAVVGAGPAGMACAAELAKMGYNVTVFEKDNAVGGVASWGIPSFRLPKDALQDSIANLKSLNVEFKLGSTLNSESEILNLLEKGYNAVFVATGLSKPVELDIFSNYENVASATDFLKAVKTKRRDYGIGGKTVAVIGGGAVAMDAATTAKALGAKRVYTVSLEDLNEMPANEEELDVARKAGVVFKPSAQITEVVNDGKKIIGLKGIETEWKVKENFSPSNAVQIKGTEFTLKADLVIQAIGSRPGFKVGEKSGVFTGGDISNGGATIAQAVGDGKKAAEKIHAFLTKGVSYAS